MHNIIVASTLACLACCLPPAAAAQVSARQDSCRTNGAYPVAFFSVANRSSAPVCRVTLVPMQGSCFLLQCGAPNGWSCFPGDVTTFYMADVVPDACIAAGEIRGRFSAELPASFCCFDVGFFTADGAHLGSQDLCFDCDTVGVERETWGGLKMRFE